MRAPSDWAITTARECATTSCMSRAIRVRSCSAAACWLASTASLRLRRDCRAVATSRPMVQASSSVTAVSSATVVNCRTASARVVAPPPRIASMKVSRAVNRPATPPPTSDEVKAAQRTGRVP